jgi:probable rRNA maturation factor
LDYTDTELSIAIVDDAAMVELNRRYRGVNATTDVLAFSMAEGEFGEIAPQMLGDVVISAPTASLMSEQHNVALTAILDLLLVHGILHLIGYDHEQGDEQARLMEAKTLQIMKRLGHADRDLSWFLHKE